jgi:hypothetical protein
MVWKGRWDRAAISKEGAGRVPNRAGWPAAISPSSPRFPVKQRADSYNIVFWLQTLFFGLKQCFNCKKHNLDASNIVWALQTLFFRLKHCFFPKNNV